MQGNIIQYFILNELLVIKRHREIFKTYCQVKEASLKG
jgi:hypothetical protein